ncbi:MAG: ThuA domain-containing protein [Flavobacteriaceae bacterium]
MRQTCSSFAILLLFSLTMLQCQPQSEGKEENLVQNEEENPVQNEEENPDQNMESAKILVFTKTAGFRHQSIEKGVSTLRNLGEENDFEITHTEEASVFSSTGLQEYDLVIFLSTTRNILDPDQESAFKAYINQGGNFMGIHAASDTEYAWSWYGKLVGAYFESHPSNPNVREADIEVVDESHPSTSHLEELWKRNDEWYNFKSINPDIQVVLNLDETSYVGGTNGSFHPIAWYHEFDGGRSFYTGGGHTEASFDEIDFQKHLLGGIEYCLRRK